MSTYSIVLGSPRPNYNYVKLVLESYVHRYDRTNNIMRGHTIGYIVLKQHNDHEKYYFISHKTWKYINSNQQTE